MIKQLLQIGIILAGFASMPSWGIAIVGGTYDETDVGAIDDFLIRSDSLANSNPTTETTFVEDYLVSQSINTDDLTFVYKFPPTGDGTSLYTTDATDVYASYIGGTGSVLDFFIVKNTKAWALFGNLENMDWAVIDTSLDELDGMNIPNDLEVSHISVFSNGGTSVPEPGIAALLGIGILGMVLARRKKTV
jgi:hypothetical protein